MTAKPRAVGSVTKFILYVTVPILYSFSYLLYNFPQVFEEPLINTFKITSVEVTSLYAISSSSAVPVDLLMVKVLQKCKLKDTAVFTAIISALGTLLTHLGIAWINYEILAIARFFFGIGMESMYVVSAVAIEKWFKASEVTLANGLSRFELELLDTMMVFFMPSLYVAYNSLTTPMLTLDVMSLVLVFSSILFYVIETRYEREKLGEKKLEEPLELDDLPQESTEIETDPSVKEDGQQEKKEESDKEEVLFEVKDFKLIPSLVWYLILFLTMAGCTLWNFTSIGVDLISKRYNVDYLTAKNYMSIHPSSCMIFIFVVLMIVKKYGYKSHSYVASSLLFIASYVALSLLPARDPGLALSLCLLGVSAGNAIFYATIAASVLLAGPSKASSFTVSCLSIGANFPSFIFAPLMGLISKERTPRAYQNCLYVLIGFAVLMFFSSLIVFYIDVKEAGSLLQRRSDDPWLIEYKEQLNKGLEDALKKKNKSD